MPEASPAQMPSSTPAPGNDEVQEQQAVPPAADDWGDFVS